ncbi:MAG: hypothetical protein A2014_06225 [Spirochaetes bacterium GWF1_49_6]|nr:MAG: hypothetical protein A2014_06225 [Spirochaetes bacterium GWF1_49_6]
MKSIIIAIAIMFLFGSFGFTSTMKIKPTTIAGFVNKGDKSDDNINVLLTKSLINLLSLIPDVIITPFSDVETAVKMNKLWFSKAIDVEKALAMGILFETKQVVVGDYKIIKNKVTINLYVYDVVTGELTLQRSFKDSPAGKDIFNTLDDVVKQVSYILVGQAITLGKINVNVDVPDTLYKVYINGRFVKEIKKGDPYIGDIIADEPIEVSIRVGGGKDEQEVFKKTVTVIEGETANIQYIPSDAKTEDKISKTVDSFEIFPGQKILINLKNGGSIVGIFIKQDESNVFVKTSDIESKIPKNKITIVAMINDSSEKIKKSDNFDYNAKAQLEDLIKSSPFLDDNNFLNIKNVAATIPDDAKYSIYKKYQKSGWGGFVINFLTIGLFGSWAIGDYTDAIIQNSLFIGSVILLASANGDAGMAGVGGFILSANIIYSLISPFTYSAGYNDKLMKALGLIYTYNNSPVYYVKKDLLYHEPDDTLIHIDLLAFSF